jgi:hypothetical protein
MPAIQAGRWLRTSDTMSTAERCSTERRGWDIGRLVRFILSPPYRLSTRSRDLAPLVRDTILSVTAVMRAKAYRYIPSRERLSDEKRSAIARNAALARARQRREMRGICECGHSETEHWSVGTRECWRCYEQDDVEPCSAFTLRTSI